MAENITRCPECATSFRISEAHLHSGKGSVRCGSCLNIFNARENLIEAQPPEQETEQEKIESEETETEAEEDILISDTMEMDAPKPIVSSAEVGDALSEEFSDTFADTFRSDLSEGEEELNLFERNDSENCGVDDEVSQDESWALDLLNDEDESNDDTPPSDTSFEEEDATESDYETSEVPESDFQTPFQIIEEELPQQEEEAPDERYHQYDDVELEEPEEDEREQTYAQPIYSTGSYPTGTDYLAAIEPEPVEFDYQTSSNFWHSKSLWGGLSATAAILLFVQIAWIKFPSLSTVEPYRSHYTKACKIIGCQLPNLIDRSKIRSTNLVVRSHPHVRGALVVDAVIQNTAKFEQRFPSLDLIFTDARDKVVAARRLHPQDYLGGELAGRSTMPIKQPIHIALEITDPGESATGYRIIIAN
ncbi:MAG: zinc-ribbon and DUF3426 domain-containing protein [Agarilytica sp.]